MKKVALFFGGVQKGGTSALHAYLARHPSLSPPATKEPHHFDDETIDWSAPDHAAYHALWPATDGARLRYDATPIHGFWPGALERIRDYNPAARLVFLFRDPFARAWSQWCMEFARGTEKLPFATALREGRARLPRDRPRDPAWRVFSYVERGYYGRQVAAALGLFGREQLLFLTSVALARDHEDTLARIARFCGIAPFPALAPLRENPRPQFAWPGLPTREDRALVAQELADDLVLFRALTGIDTTGWTGAL